MSVMDRIKQKVETKSIIDIEFMDEPLKIKLVPMGQLARFLDLTVEEQLRYIQDKIIDTETMKPAFTFEYLNDEMPNAYLNELLRTFFAKNRGGEDIEDLEKN
jgi:hypothetical protein